MIISWICNVFSIKHDPHFISFKKITIVGSKPMWKYSFSHSASPIETWQLGMERENENHYYKKGFQRWFYKAFSDDFELMPKPPLLKVKLFQQRFLKQCKKHLSTSVMPETNVECLLKWVNLPMFYVSSINNRHKKYLNNYDFSHDRCCLGTFCIGFN